MIPKDKSAFTEANLMYDKIESLSSQNPIVVFQSL